MEQLASLQPLKTRLATADQGKKTFGFFSEHPILTIPVCI